MRFCREIDGIGQNADGSNTVFEAHAVETGLTQRYALSLTLVNTVSEGSVGEIQEETIGITMDQF